MQTSEIFQKLLNHFGKDVILELTEANEEVRDPFITVLAKKIDKISLYCRVETDFYFDHCQSITGVDTQETFTCVYHLFSYVHKHTLVIKTTVAREDPSLPSCIAVWPSADWYEREVYDLYGVRFEGHPDLRRLLLPEDWQGHPMRKDWQEPPTYRTMSTSRETPLDLLVEPSIEA